MAWIDTLFRRMVDVGASDLHMSSTLRPMFRISGDMHPIEGCPEITPEQMRQILYEITPEANRTQFEAESDTDFAYDLPGAGRYRCNLFMDRRGIGGVFRLIPSKIMSVQELGLSKAVIDLCYLTKGLVLVTGPTGSGKSTTLASMIDHVNSARAEHIITIEDPIEFVHQDKKCLINQREVHRHTDSFKRALRAALREDPNIVLVGEMRDLETVEIALETAETGHLVFGTLHTSTAASTIDRIIDQFPSERQAQIRTMLSSSLKGVIAQSLCKRIPKGRCAAFEVLIVNNAVAANIREGKTHQIPSAMQIGGKQGMRLMNDSLLELVKGGLVDPMEGYLKAVQKDDMLTKYRQSGIKFDTSRLGGEAESPMMSQPSPAVPVTQQGAYAHPTSSARSASPMSTARTAPGSAPAPAAEPVAEDGSAVSPLARFRKPRPG